MVLLSANTILCFSCEILPIAPTSIFRVRRSPREIRLRGNNGSDGQGARTVSE
jgi:hypothetical protein